MNKKCKKHVKVYIPPPTNNYWSVCPRGLKENTTHFLRSSYSSFFFSKNS
jgi:hypothetical protein